MFFFLEVAFAWSTAPPQRCVRAEVAAPDGRSSVADDRLAAMEEQMNSLKQMCAIPLRISFRCNKCSGKMLAKRGQHFRNLRV